MGRTCNTRGKMGNLYFFWCLALSKLATLKTQTFIWYHYY